MGKVSIEESNVLAILKREVGEVKSDMQQNLNFLNTAFEIAGENWKDVNAQTCKAALEDHNIEMRSQLDRLNEIENALNRLYSLAKKYEDI